MQDLEKSKELQALVALLEIGSTEYAEGKHVSAEELKTKLRTKFTNAEEVDGNE